MALALAAAERFAGATSPNPPVGAVGLDERGEVLSIQAHERAGTAHAEARVIEDCRARGTLARLHTLVVTLEPCNHQGRTPACTEAILATSVRRVIYGARDPNPRVAGGGAARLAATGIEVSQEVEHEAACAELIRAFAHHCRTGRPWITVKVARDERGSMIPPAGLKTFTSPGSLKFAHELRRRADALITGSGTVLADSPLFTVRRVPDFPGKTRWLIILDRRGRVPDSFVRDAEGRGFRVRREADLAASVRWLGEQGVQEVLVEAGPTLSGAILESGIWDESVVISRQSGHADRIEITRNVHGNHRETGQG
jgi:diaminohydroxyphosphoribosylaminopyrimidine deaminase/5-amino-6-(5-phosphoribosylamino)uracil reductase